MISGHFIISQSCKCYEHLQITPPPPPFHKTTLPHIPIDIERLKIDCLQFGMCPLLALGFQGFFFLFLMRPLTVLMKQTRQVRRAFKKSIYLDVYAQIQAYKLDFLTHLHQTTWSKIRQAY